MPRPQPIGSRPATTFAKVEPGSGGVPPAPGVGIVQGRQGGLQCSRAAAEMGLAVRSDCAARQSVGVVVLTTSSAASSPTDRAASRSSGAASRSLARHTGESTTKHEPAAVRVRQPRMRGERQAAGRGATDGPVRRATRHDGSGHQRARPAAHRARLAESKGRLGGPGLGIRHQTMTYHIHRKQNPRPAGAIGCSRPATAASPAPRRWPSALLLGCRRGASAPAPASPTTPCCAARPTTSEALIAATRRDAQREINALAARLGELQAEANRLNALGERLTRIGQLQDGEFDFDKPVGVGGAGPVRDMTKGELRRGHGQLGPAVRGLGRAAVGAGIAAVQPRARLNAMPVARADRQQLHHLRLRRSRRSVQRRPASSTRASTSRPTSAIRCWPWPMAWSATPACARATATWSRSTTATATSPVTRTTRA